MAAEGEAAHGTKSVTNLASIEAIAVIASSGHPRIHYNASKGAVRMLTKALALELGPKGIPVNSICPGVTETPLTAENLAKADRGRGSSSTPSAASGRRPTSPGRRPSSPPTTPPT